MRSTVSTHKPTRKKKEVIVNIFLEIMVYNLLNIMYNEC